RVEVAVLPSTDGDPRFAVVVIDKGGDIETHRHGLACISQRRPVQASCRDEKIELDTIGEARILKRPVHYLLHQRDDTVVMIVSPDRALVESLRDAEIQGSDQLTHVVIDVGAVLASPLAELAGSPLEIAADFIGRIEANVGIDSDGLHWQLGFTPTVSVAQLARIAGPAFVEYARRTKEVEAIINLESLALAAVSRHHEQGTYPVAVD